jgi:hypothetical protein
MVSHGFCFHQQQQRRGCVVICAHEIRQKFCNCLVVTGHHHVQVGNVTTQAVERDVLSFSSMCVKVERKRSNGIKYYDEGADLDSCRSKCSSKGGTYTGVGYSSFTCTILQAPTAICVRLSKNAGNWTITQGALPGRGSGATGAGEIPSFRTPEVEHISCLTSIRLTGNTTKGTSEKFTYFGSFHGPRCDTATSGTGCFHTGSGWTAVQKAPFQESTTLQIPVTLRSERDPYLYFLDISDGSLNFGLTTGEVWINSSLDEAR